MKRLHPSNLVDWQGCGKRFELITMMDERPRWRNHQAINGTAIHSVIERIHRDGLWDTGPQEIQRLYVDSFAAAILEPKNPNESLSPVFWGDMGDEAGGLAYHAPDSIAMIEGYRGDERNRDAEILLLENTWRATFGGFDWEGTIDQVRRGAGGSIELVDLKTGKERPGPIPLAMWPQGLTYAMASEHAVFHPRGADQHTPWTPMSFKVSRLTWAHLRDYVPYKRSGRTPSGVVYKAGDTRGQVFYTIDVKPKVLDAHAREIRMFADAVQAGRFERRPSNHQCSRCTVSEVCLRDFTESVDGLVPSFAVEGEE